MKPLEVHLKALPDGHPHLGEQCRPIGVEQSVQGTADAVVGQMRHLLGAEPHVELPAGEVIEEEERLGALHEDIVGAHRDQVDADRVMAGEREREL